MTIPEAKLDSLDALLDEIETQRHTAAHATPQRHNQPQSECGTLAVSSMPRWP